MKKLLFLIVAIIGINSKAQQLAFSWIKETAKTSIENISSDITLDKNGDIICVGTFNDSAVFGDTTLVSYGLHDIFLAKLDTLGNWIWAVQFGGYHEDCGKAIAVDNNNNIIITGSYTDSAQFGDTIIHYNQSYDYKNSFVVKLNENGQIIWVKNLYASQISTSDIAVKEDDIIFCGSYQGTFSLDDDTINTNAFNDVFIANLDKNGKCKWLNTTHGLNNNSDAYSTGLVIYNNNDVGITGYFGGQFVIGNDTLLTTEESDMSSFIAKCNKNGKWIWNVQLQGEHGEWAYTIDKDKDENTIIAGIFDGTAIFGSDTLIVTWDINLFLAKIDSSKNWIFAIQTGGNSSAEPHKIIVDKNNNTIVTGYFYYDSISFDTITLVSNGEEDIFIAYCDKNGNWLSAISYGNQGRDFGNSVVVDTMNNLFISGVTSVNISYLKSTTIENETYNIIGKLILKKNNIAAKGALINTLSYKNFYAFPNPFETDISIIFSIEQPNNYSIIIYNINGELVFKTDNKFYNTGTYHLQWNNNNILPGTYICNLFKNDILINNYKIIKR